MERHWHFNDGTNNEDPFVTTDIYRLFPAIEEELKVLGEIEYQGITAYGTSKMFESAYHSFLIWQTLDNLLSNVQNVTRQHEANVQDRAPLFRDSGLNDYDSASPLNHTARHVLDQVNAETELDVYSCTAFDIIGDEDGEWHESYSMSGA